MRVFTGQLPRLVAAVLLLVACRVGPGEEKDKGGVTGETDGGEDSDSGAGTDSDSGVEGDTDSDADADSATGSDSGTDTNADTGSSDVVSFVGELRVGWRGTDNGKDFFEVCMDTYDVVGLGWRTDCDACEFAFDVDVTPQEYPCGSFAWSTAWGYDADADNGDRYELLQLKSAWGGSHWAPQANASFDGITLAWYSKYEITSREYNTTFMYYYGSGTLSTQK